MAQTLNPITQVELLLPKAVLETCLSLNVMNTAEFISKNINNMTMTKMRLLKHLDESVKVTVTVLHLQTELALSQPDHILITNDSSSHTPSVDQEHVTTVDMMQNIITPGPQAVINSLQINSPHLDVDTVSNVESTSKDDNSDYSKELLPSKDILKPMDLHPAQNDESEIDNHTFSNSNVESFARENDLQLGFSSKGEQNSTLAQTNSFEVELETTKMNTKNTKINAKQEKSVVIDSIPGDDCTTTRGDDNLKEELKTDSLSLKPVSSSKRPYYRREANVKCILCSKMLKNYDSVLEHCRVFHKQEPDVESKIEEVKELMKQACQHCDKIFPNTMGLITHNRMVHATGPQAKCEQCGVTVKSHIHLERHMKRLHTEEKHSGFLCHHCPTSFKFKAYLKNHIRNVHPNIGERTFECEVCSQRFLTAKYLYNHRIRVHGEKRYVCEHCLKAFTNQNNLKRHVLLVHEKSKHKNFKCEYCGKEFSLKANLKEHVNIVHLSKWKVKCDACQLGFRRIKELKQHACPAFVAKEIKGGVTIAEILEQRHNNSYDAK